MFGEWLLCDFHIHTIFSDGELALEEIIDIYGEKGFDAIAITDHILDKKSEENYHIAGKKLPAITKDDFNDYLHALWQASQKSWEKYHMILIPGMEITNDTKKFHILGIDIKQYINPDQSVEEIIAKIHDQGGIAVACHPDERGHEKELQSVHLWRNHKKFSKLFDAWEVANRDDLFNVIGLKKFNYIANSDFHRLRHLYSWKTLLMCEKNPEAIKQTIRLNHGVSIYLFRKNKRSVRLKANPI
jgi:predicted metal-dependent phosphoesterase TrpH